MLIRSRLQHLFPGNLQSQASCLTQMLLGLWLQLRCSVCVQADLDFDGVLRYCIQLSGRLDLQQLLRCAEKLCLLGGQAGQECLTAAGLKP